VDDRYKLTQSTSLSAWEATRIERFAALDADTQDMLLDVADMGLYVDLGYDEDLAVATLRENEYFGVLKGVVLRQRDAWMLNFARGMAMSPNLVDQREVDEKRGYFKGALYYVHHLPRISQRRLRAKEAESVIAD
jgi:hypothetical protein